MTHLAHLVGQLNQLNLNDTDTAPLDIVRNFEVEMGSLATSHQPNDYLCEEARFLPCLNECTDRHVRNTFFFGGQTRQPFLGFTKPNSPAHPAYQRISHTFELWLKETLWAHNGEVPILENNPQVTANAIMEKLKQGSIFDNLSRVLINIRAGHVYSLHVITDEIIEIERDQEFFQEYPLFMEATIKVQPVHPSATRHPPCQVLVAVEYVADTTFPAPHGQMACVHQYITPGLYFNGASVGEKKFHP